MLSLDCVKCETKNRVSIDPTAYSKYTEDVFDSSAEQPRSNHKKLFTVWQLLLKAREDSKPIEWTPECLESYFLHRLNISACHGAYISTDPFDAGGRRLE